MATYLIMSGVSSCTDMDEMYGTVGGEDEAKALVARLNEAGHRIPGHSFFYETLGPFPGMDDPTLARSLRGPVPGGGPGGTPPQGPGR